MEGLVKEGSEVMEEGFEDAVLDAGLIGAARRVEHYEMAAYGTAREIARVLGQTKHTSLLEKTLAEEKQTDEKLADLAKEINSQANEEGSEEQQDSSGAGKKTPKRAA
jgi:ferritin-like metal-binding protein YciE